MRNRTMTAALLLAMASAPLNDAFAQESAPQPATAEKPSLFVSWETMEPDKMASIWLIRRFVNPKAEIRFLPHGTPITKGIAFDTPDAELRRVSGRCCSEMLVERYRITDPKAIGISRLMHEIELNKGIIPLSPEADRLYNAALKVMDECGNGEKCVGPSLKLMDEWIEVPK